MACATTELFRGHALTSADLKFFLRENVAMSALAYRTDGSYAPVTRDRVVFDRDRFEFARYAPGHEAVNAYTVVLDDELGEAADILAFRPDGAAALWQGHVAVAGEHQILEPRLEAPLDVHETVVDWLRADRQGIVMLDPRRAAWRLDGVTLRTRTPALARSLRTRLARPAPRIVVLEPERRAA